MNLGEPHELQQRKAELLEQKLRLEAELAKVNQEIEESKPKPVFIYGNKYYQPKIVAYMEPIIMSYEAVSSNSEYLRNPDGLFMFKTLEQCQRFNEKLLELARRKAKILYGEVEKPEPLTIIGSGTKAHIHNETLIIEDSDGHIVGIPLDEVCAVADYCNQVLDYLENRGVRV